MTDPTNHPPLWRVIRDAFGKSPRPPSAEVWGDHHGYAAELRAIADAIENPCTDWQQSFSSDLDIIYWLRAEADRAEAGG